MINTRFIMINSNNTECRSWNCCDENLQACIDRSDYVRIIRKRLKDKYKKGKYS